MATLIWSNGKAEADAVIDFDESDLGCSLDHNSDHQPPLSLDEIYSHLKGVDLLNDPAFNWPENITANNSTD